MKPGAAASIAERYAASIRMQVSAYERVYPNLARSYFRWQRENALDLPSTLPAELKSEIRRRIDLASRDVAVNLIFTGQDVGSIALWERNRIVYSIDPDLWQAIGDTDDDTEVPAGLFGFLPHPDPFIALPEPLIFPLAQYGDVPGAGDRGQLAGLYQKVGGFFLSGRREVTGQITWPGLTQRSTHAPGVSAFALLFIGEIFWPDGRPYILPDGLGHDIIYTRVTIADGGTVGDMIAKSKRIFLPAGESTAWHWHMPKMVRRAMALIVYLCATNADLRPVPVPPAKRKGGSRRRDDTHPRVVEVGYQVGAAIREYRARPADASTRAEPTGRKVRPHIRRAHFQTFLYGPGRPNQRTIRRVKWLGPIEVNITDPADRPTVHDVPTRSSHDRELQPRQR